MPEVIIALDVPSASRALEIVDTLGPRAGFYKVGLELFSREGPDIVRVLKNREKRVFLDLKLHDIPNTVAGAVRAAADLGVDLLTVHVSGGVRMLEAAAEQARDGLRLVGVTVLTSFAVPELESVWGRDLVSLRDEVVRLGTLARDAGVHGVVASPEETAALKRRLGKGFLVVTPGIRLPGDPTHDQTRVATPAVAARAGADFLVVGRSVTAAPDPLRALDEIRADLSAPEGEEG